MSDSDPRASLFATYARLGLKITSFEKLGWDGERKTGVQRLERFNRADQGYLLNTKESNVTVIDLDGEDKGAKHSARTQALYDILRPACNMIAKSGKVVGHHFVFKHNPLLKAGQKGDMDILTNSSCVIVEPSQYQKGKKLVKYKWLMLPTADEGLMEIPPAAVEMLLDAGCGIEPRSPFIAVPNSPEPLAMPPRRRLAIADAADSDGEEVMENTVVMTETTRRNIETPYEELVALCDCLSADWLDAYNNWLKLGMCIKHFRDDAKHRDLFLKVSRKAARHDTPGTIANNRKLWDSWKPDGRIRIDSLHYWARTQDKAAYFRIKKARYWALVLGGSKNDFCEMFHAEMEGEVVYSKQSGSYFIWNTGRERWLECGSGYIYSLFLETVLRATDKLIMEIPAAVAGDEKSEEKRKERLKAAGKFKKACDGNTVTAVSSFLPSFYNVNPEEKDPNDVFNKNPDLLPLANGVWVFSEGRLRPYEREDFFTKRIPITYDADAPTEDIEKAMLQWFPDEEVRDFIRFYIGYLMTGYVKRQDFLIIWGTTASNAKSTLWVDILHELLGGTGEGGYAQTMSMEAFRENQTESKPELYDSDGRRLATIDDPSDIKISQGVVKALTGTNKYKCRTLHKECKTFALSVRVVVLCNSLPQYKIEDEGVFRRILIGEMKTSFLSPEKWALLSEEQRSDGRHFLKDLDFAKRLVANMSGILNYFLVGASAFIAEPNRSPPAMMRAAKDKASSILDTLGAWVRGNLKKLEKTAANRKKTVSYATMKEIWAEQKLEFPGMRSHAFKHNFLTQLETAGYEVDRGTEGKSREKVVYCEMIRDDTMFAEDEEENVITHE